MTIGMGSKRFFSLDECHLLPLLKKSFHTVLLCFRAESPKIPSCGSEIMVSHFVGEEQARVVKEHGFGDSHVPSPSWAVASKWKSLQVP